MKPNFTEKSEQKIQEALSHYPTRQAALLPVFWIAQEQFGWISQEVMELIAARLDLSPAHVYGVATFYTMLYKKPVGEYHLQVCRTLPCALMGSDSIIGHLKKRLGIEDGETTEDKKFTLTTVECLASCGTGPAMMVNEKYYEGLTAEKVDQILEKLK
ncbi:MAG: NADH-quinone oxidoreductase subunit NuoE [Deltaproteobacteria bacterium]|nr:NADH-quinone oxidoreductase subunit NuoE [Deltaproteobacteria bacterium]